MSITGETETPTYIDDTSSDDSVYEEADDVSPLSVYYDKDNLPIVITDDDILRDHKEFKPKRSYLRNVRNSKRRYSK